MRAGLRRLGLTQARPVRRGSGAMVAAALALLAWSAPASAGNFPVDNLADSGGPVGSLRWAINQADASNDPTNTIPITVNGTIELQSALPTLSKPMQIEGPGPGSLDVHRQTGGSYSIFGIGSAVTVSISGLTVSNGAASSVGGGILVDGTLTLTNITVSGNTAVNSGGGIYNNGRVTITDSTVSGNVAPRGGGIENFVNSGLAITDSTISGNQAGDGGGIVNSGGVATLTDSTVSDNAAGDRAGAILNENQSATMTIDSSTVSHNFSNGNAGHGGGGIQNDGTGAGSSPPQLTIVNSTIVNNGAANNGGGVDTFTLDASPTPSQMPTTTVASSTVAANSAGGAGGGLNEFQGNFVVRNSIVARNAAGSNPDCSNVQPNSPDFGSEGYNLIGDTTGCTGFTGVGDLVNFDPLLAGSGSALNDNGGPTKTIALLVGSPVLHAGNPAAPGSSAVACPAVDQRGHPRGGAAGRCDIGAVQPGPPAITIKTPAGGATFAQGQGVTASYSCTADPTTTIASCLGPVANGAPVDTSTLGSHAFTVNATDTLGADATNASNYTVVTTPPKPQITEAKINAANGRATFKFTDTGKVTGYQCALIKHRNRRSTTRFTSCRSPKTYKHLRPGKSTFEVEALIGTVISPAAKRKFTS